ncbi:MAG: hypothetical protein RR633_20385 [Acinetobacter sp.]
MSTEVNVQYFSHSNGLVLGNSWGDLIRLLDTCLVNGLPLSSITSASIDTQGDIILNFYAAHNCMLFQIVELSSFTSVQVDAEARTINGKYRIKGVPTTTQIILKGIPRTAENSNPISITNIGTAKLASLGYEIIFRDGGDVKRVYRAKNPNAEHPFIRVDETISDGTNTYSSTYVKSAMVGLLENMTHIDDYLDPSKIQLPLATSNFNKNWGITGSGSTVVRGWAKWVYASSGWVYSLTESNTPNVGLRKFTLCGDLNSFYFLVGRDTANTSAKFLNGCGVYDAALLGDVVPNWFLMATLKNNAAGSSIDYGTIGFTPLLYTASTSKFLTTNYNLVERVSNSIYTNAVMPNYTSGNTNIFSGTTLPALQIPFYDDSAKLRGSLNHVLYSGKVSNNYTNTTPILSNNSMYIADSAAKADDNNSLYGFYFYLGELE